jgi:hypothetical protein
MQGDEKHVQEDKKKSAGQKQARTELAGGYLSSRVLLTHVLCSQVDYKYILVAVKR